MIEVNVVQLIIDSVEDCNAEAARQLSLLKGKSQLFRKSKAIWNAVNFQVLDQICLSCVAPRSR